MPTETTTKAERIRQLLDAGMCNTMIAELVGCGEPYVRTVKQRLSPAKRAKDCARFAAMAKTADKSLVRRAYRIAYREARKAGASVADAGRSGARARIKAIHATGDTAAARAAYHAAKRGTVSA